MKKKMVIIPIIIIVAIVFIILGVLFFTSIKVTNTSISMINYTSIPITENEINLINSKNLNCADYCDLWQLRKISKSDYGNMFEVFYEINLKRYNPLNDYHVTEQIDFSDLTEDEKVFFLKVNGDVDSFVFEEEYDENSLTATNYVYLTGITYGKNINELEEIIRKVKIKLILQDKNGKIIERQVALTDNAILQQKESDADIDAARETLKKKNNDKELFLE